MAATAITPHTRIDNVIIDNVAAQIGIYSLGIYVAIKRHLNQKTGDCFPSYQTIAKKLHVDRGTVIRYVKKLKAFNLLDPQLRFKEDGSPASNQYNFGPAETSAPSGGCSKQPEVVADANLPGCAKPPEQVFSSNKKERTIEEVDLSADRQDLMPTEKLPQDTRKSPVNSRICPSENQKDVQPTEKQRTCPHPPTEIVFLADNVTLCHHCYGLLNEKLTLQEGQTPSSPDSIGMQSEELVTVEIVAA